MNTYWKDYQGNDETFWEHEWGKHGTCISTLDTKCYSGHSGQEEVVDYFEVAVELFKGLDSFAVSCTRDLSGLQSSAVLGDSNSRTRLFCCT